jgi:hypothetical protein
MHEVRPSDGFNSDGVAASIGLGTLEPLYAIEPARPVSRGTGKRVALWFGCIGAHLVAAFALGLVVGYLMARGTYTTEAARNAAVHRATLVAVPLWIASMLAFWMSQLRRLGYRWFDAFGLFAPIWGLVQLFRWTWRLTALPDRYWSVRDDEMAYDEDLGVMAPVQVSGPNRALRRSAGALAILVVAAGAAFASAKTTDQHLSVRSLSPYRTVEGVTVDLPCTPTRHPKTLHTAAGTAQVATYLCPGADDAFGVTVYQLPGSTMDLQAAAQGAARAVGGSAIGATRVNAAGNPALDFRIGGGRDSGRAVVIFARIIDANVTAAMLTYEVVNPNATTPPPAFDKFLSSVRLPGGVAT